MSDVQKTAITNVRVFDGLRLSEPTTIAFENGYITTDPSGALEIDGQGMVLLPGLIDAHVHCTKREELVQMAKAGITTALDMGSWPVEVVDSLRNQLGLTDYCSAGLVLTAPGSSHSCLRTLPEEALVVGKAQAADFVNRRVAEGSDYIKLIADIPGPDQESLDAATEEAKRCSKLVIAHATGYEPLQMAQKAKVDFLTHVPIDKAVADEDVRIMIEERRACIPTLAMMETVSKLGFLGNNYANCKESVRLMHEAGVPILAGTDANDIPSSPAPLKHGMIIHRELELLVEAGLSPSEALRSATVVAAEQFGLRDRGKIEQGLRADLVLVDGDPLRAISETHRIQRVWCGGIEVV